MFKNINKHKKFISIFLTAFLLIYAIPINQLSYANQDELLLNDVGVDLYITSRISDDGNIYLTNNNAKDSKSATAVISGTVASSLISLAVKAGVVFLSAGAIDEFLYRVCNITDSNTIFSQITDAISNSVDGVVNFSRSLLDSIQGLIFNATLSKSVRFYQSGDMKIPLLPYGFPLKNSTIVQLANMGVSGVSATVGLDETVNKQFDILGHIYQVELVPGGSVNSPSLKFYVDKQNPTSGAWVTAVSDYIYTYDTGFAYPFLYQKTSGGRFYIGGVMLYKKSPGSSYTQGLYVKSNVGNYSELDLTGVSIDTQIGSAWSDGAILGDDGTEEGDVAIKIPSNMGDLVNQGSDSVTSSPSYPTWKPGDVIVLPGVDNPSVDIEKPATPPSTDTDTPATSWEWLKELLNTMLTAIQTIANWVTSFWDTFTEAISSAITGSWEWLKDLIQSILDWLNSFWDSLLEFLTNILVPSESYWVDSFEEVETALTSKIPNIDISILEDMASGEVVFEDIYATFFGQRCLVVRASLINNVIGWARPILQGVIALFLLLYNYNQVYHLLRSHNLVSAGRGEE